MADEYRLRDDVAGYTRDYGLQDGRLVMAPERLAFWKEYFHRIPESQKRQVITELLAWTVKCVRSVSEKHPEAVAEGTSGIEEALDNTTAIVAEVMGAVPLAEPVLPKEPPARFWRGKSHVVISEGESLSSVSLQEPPSAALDQRVAFNLEELRTNMQQARSEATKTSRLFRAWIAVGLGLVALGVLGMMLGFLVPGIVTSIGGVLPGGLAATLHQKDKECHARLAALDAQIQSSDRYLAAMAAIDAIENPAARTKMRTKLGEALIAQIGKPV